MEGVHTGVSVCMYYLWGWTDGRYRRVRREDALYVNLLTVRYVIELCYVQPGDIVDRQTKHANALTGSWTGSRNENARTFLYLSITRDTP